VTNFALEIPASWAEYTARNVEFTKISISSLGLDTEKVCLLDSEAAEGLAPADGSHFTHFLFGGILGNGI